MGYVRDLVCECNILFQDQQLPIAKELRRSYNDSGLELWVNTLFQKLSAYEYVMMIVNSSFFFTTSFVRGQLWLFHSQIQDYIVCKAFSSKLLYA